LSRRGPLSRWPGSALARLRSESTLPHVAGTHSNAHCKRLRTFALNRLDFALYEKLHRDFCSRLDQAGIRTEPQVQVDLERSRFCGDFKFDNVEDVCGRLDHPDVIAKLKGLRQNAAHFLDERRIYAEDLNNAQVRNAAPTQKNGSGDFESPLWPPNRPAGRELI